MSRPEAVLFDMDGLLLDSEPLWTVAEEELAADLGGHFTSAIKRTMIGKRLEVSVPLFLAGLGTAQARAADPEAVAHRLLHRVAELFDAGPPLRPGARELLQAVASARVPAALVSSSYRRLVDAALRVLGAGTFAVTVAGDELAAGKPHPEPYLTAARRLAVAPGRCAVVEDSWAGVEAARAAGCGCVWVPTFPPDDVPAGVVVRRSLHNVDLNLLARVTTESLCVDADEASDAS